MRPFGAGPTARRRATCHRRLVHRRPERTSASGWDPSACSSARVAAEPEGNPGLSNHNSEPIAMHHSISPLCDQMPTKAAARTAAFSTLSRPQCVVLLILDAQARPWPEGLIRPKWVRTGR